MATYQNITHITDTADAPTTIYRFTDTGGAFATEDAYCDGICAESVQANQEYNLIAPTGSIVKIEAQGVISNRADIAVGTDGKAKAAATGDIIVAKALEAAAADGDIIEAHFLFRGAKA